MKIDPKEEFELLPKAPIVEAVIQISARPEGSWLENDVSKQLESILPDYPTKTSQNKLSRNIKIDVQKFARTVEDNFGWYGFFCQSADQIQSVQFNLDGMMFSRLAPYQKWETFSNEAKRLWTIYQKLAQPSEIQRIGLRFVNRMALPSQQIDWGQYMKAAPEAPKGLDMPLTGFFHQDTLSVPDRPYALNVIRTVQQPDLPGEIGLIVDIDVYTTQPITDKPDALDGVLTDLRWLKNKVFFGSMTTKSLELFR
jgi:uncharacterized protein (TIGR04255 family)